MNNKKKNNKPEKPAEASETTTTREYNTGDMIEYDGEKYLFVDTGGRTYLFSEYEQGLAQRRTPMLPFAKKESK